MSTQTESNLSSTSVLSRINIECLTLPLKEALHHTLGTLDPFSECALLDHPNRTTNVGDNMIWLGELFYLSQTLKATISYAANIESFSDKEMNKQDNNVPILLHGGNFGDLWKGSQDFRNYIISKYKKRPLVISSTDYLLCRPQSTAKNCKGSQFPFKLDAGCPR